MIITRTPLRVSFAGGGSDFEGYYTHTPGFVVSATINKYMYICLNHKPGSGVRVGYSKTENVDRVEYLEHDLARECLQAFAIHKSVEVVSIADVAAGTGLGSSSAYTVGLLRALVASWNTTAEPMHLAERACQIEINKCHKPIGKQDQYAAAFGGFRWYEFKPTHVVTGLVDYPKELSQHLMLFDTKLIHRSEDILTAQSASLSDRDNRRKVSKLVTVAKTMVDELQSGHIDSFGRLLHDAWLIKKDLSHGITNSKIDDLYCKAVEAGALGGKICGAGGGGYMLLYVPLDKQDAVREALAACRRMQFVFEPEGSKVVYRD